MDNNPERLLVERAVSGDREAFKCLYQQNVGAVFAFVRSRVGSGPAEDLTAETFCRAFESITRFEWRGVPFRAWLLRIAYHQIVGRSRRKDTKVLLLEDPVEVARPGHEEAVVSAIEGDGVLAALATLPNSHAAVLDLRFLHDLSVPETAEILEISEEAVRALTYRALKALREAHSRGAGESRRNPNED